MSDTGKAGREWRFYVEDMRKFAQKVLAYTQGMSQQEFVDSGITYDATLRNLELIGEAATHVPDEVRQSHPEIPWRLIIATRNRLIHAYLGIDNDTIWSIVQDDIPGRGQPGAVCLRRSGSGGSHSATGAGSAGQAARGDPGRPFGHALACIVVQNAQRDSR